MFLGLIFSAEIKTDYDEPPDLVFKQNLFLLKHAAASGSLRGPGAQTARGGQLYIQPWRGLSMLRQSLDAGRRGWVQRGCGEKAFLIICG